MLGFVFRNKAHAQHMLVGCTNIHGEEVVDSLRAETLNMSLASVEALARNLCVVF